jgi:two-component system, chemotaxis family, chemotaxis protein CheY
MSYTILIVDDSAVVRTMVKKSIGMAGLPIGAVLEAGNGREALEVLSREWVDIVFADLNMPEMNGAELVEKMSQDATLVSTPVVIVSSEQSQARIDELKAKGIRAYIKKPFRPEGFREVVEDVLGSPPGPKGGKP